jgi:DNA-binding NtrC family response regulator
MGKRKAKPEPDRILVADDDAGTRRLLEFHLKEAGFLVVQAADGREALDRMAPDVALALLDLRMPKVSGMDCLRELRRKFPEAPVIITSEFGDVSDAVEAVKLGAVTFLAKPVEPEKLLEQIRAALRPGRLASENLELRQAVSLPAPAEIFVGKSPAAVRLIEQLRKLAPLDSTVLIRGESGTGKTTLARLLHANGPRAKERFITVSCGALPANLIEAQLFGHVRGAFTDAVADRPGSVEMADGGTLFLDEIGDLPLELQPKLLTFLQDRTFQRIGDPRTLHADVRVVAATHQRLEAKIADRSFREDLFYRLNVLPIEAPPLRDRPDDIPLFARFVLDRLAAKRNSAPFELTADATTALLRHSWPGNMRELENVLERAATFCTDGKITALDLNLSPGRPTPTGDSLGLAGMTMDEIERRAIIETLAKSGGNKKAAAKMLDIDEKSIYNKMRRLGLMPPGAEDV